jgi:hypothetical protein
MTLDPFGDEDSGVVFRDVVTMALIGIVALVVILLLHINPPLKEAQADVTPPGNLIVEITWPNELDADVDLWVQAPGDVPVGYSNQGGRVFNLLRDDLGHLNDPSEVNLETAYSRGTPRGEYTVNVHLYRNRVAVFPVEVQVTARVKRDASANTETLVTRRIKLDHTGSEVTAFRFRLTQEGRLVPGSITMLPRPLRSA